MDDRVDWSRVLLAVFIAAQIAVPAVALAVRWLTSTLVNPWGWQMFG